MATDRLDLAVVITKALGNASTLTSNAIAEVKAIDPELGAWMEEQVFQAAQPSKAGDWGAKLRRELNLLHARVAAPTGRLHLQSASTPAGRAEALVQLDAFLDAVAAQEVHAIVRRCAAEGVAVDQAELVEMCAAARDDALHEIMRVLATLDAPSPPADVQPPANPAASAART